MQEVENTTPSDLPSIPIKRYYSIGEVSELCAVKPHVLRYWEQEFPQLKPTKRTGNRRYYLYKDILLVREIKHTLYDLGYTIAGARQRLSGTENTTDTTSLNKQVIRETLLSLESILETLKG